MILYLLKSALCLALLLAVYRLFLEREKMHRFNRGYLLFTLISSLIIPLLPLGAGDQLLSWWYSSHAEAGAVQSLQPSGPDGGSVTPNTDNSRLSWSFLIKTAGWVYAASVLALLARLLVHVESIVNGVRRHARFYYRDSTVVLLKKQTAPFSFLGYIFLNEHEYNSGQISREILIHENTHIRQKHSWDILLVEVLKSIFWFNPLYRYAKSALQLNHEFLADQAVLRKTDRVTDYQKLLLRRLEAGRPVQFSSSFNLSQIKKRLQMMNRQPALGRSAFKMGSILPVVAAALFLFGASVPAEEGSSKHVIHLEVKDSKVIKLNDVELHILQLNERLGEYTALPDHDILLRIHKHAYFSVVLDIEQILRKHNVFSFRYLPSENGNSKYEEMIKSRIDLLVDEFVERSNEYMELSVADQREEAERYFTTIRHQYSLLIEHTELVRQNHAFDLPAPPPLPPNPGERLKKLS